ncbi:MAG: hypothetical protein FWG89_09080 [Treponema sp.]|nr:hypothetical protein [Treponema sp.]
MKKLGLLFVFVFLVISTVLAQGWAPPASSETTRVQGTLQLQNGHIVLVSGSTVYFVPGLMRYIGFIDGLREGAQVSVVGYTFNNVIRLTQLTIGGREYDFGSNNPGWSGQAGGWCCRGGGHMRGGGGHHWGGRR